MRKITEVALTSFSKTGPARMRVPCVYAPMTYAQDSVPSRSPCRSRRISGVPNVLCHTFRIES